MKNIFVWKFFLTNADSKKDKRKFFKHNGENRKQK